MVVGSKIANFGYGESKRIGPYNFASHFLQANVDIRTIGELWGYINMKTTMIYTHSSK